MDTLILTAEDVHRIARRVGLTALMDLLIDRLTEAFVAYDPGRTTIPIRDGLTYTRPKTGLLEWMPCLQGEKITLKVVGYHPENPAQHQVPTILSTASAYDASSGHLRCMMDGTLLTALRTGAASAVATNVLAARGAETVGLIGAGAQAVTQLHAITRVRDVQRLLVYDIRDATLATFADRVASFADGLVVETSPPTTIVREADIICTATSVDVGCGPVFDDVEPQPWSHFNAVGSDFPGKTELPPALLRRSLVSPDFRAQAIREGECQQMDPDTIGPSLYKILQQPDAYSGLRDGLTVFDSTGWALEDHVAMELFLEYAEAWDLGTRLPIESVSDDPHAPYRFASDLQPSVLLSNA